MYTIDIKNFRKVDKGSLKANFGIVINDCIDINNIKLVYSEKTSRYYVFFPDFEYKSKRYTLVNLSASLTNKVLDKALEEYDKKKINLLS